MRLRSIGPGIGGLYYAPLLRDTKTPEDRVAPPSAVPAQVAPDLRPGSAARVRDAVVGALKRFGKRFIEARMAEAEARIATIRYLHDVDGSVARARAIGVRYY